MVLENFVNFKERSVLDFSKTKYGPNIFVGASSTGKTAVLELIRRCMDIKLNSSLTNRCNESETAYVFCEFENTFDNYEGTIISGMIVDTVHEDNVDDDEEDEEWEENEKVNKEDTIFHKVIMYVYKGKIKFCSKTYFKTPDDRIVDLKKNVRLGKDFLDDIKVIDNSLFTANNGRKPNKNYEISSRLQKDFNIAFVEKVSNEIRKQQKDNRIHNRYPKVWGALEDGFVGVLSMRGLGTFQWTKSLLIDDKFKSKNYEGASAQAEIIAELIESKEIDRNRERKIFNFLTSESNFHFVKKPNSAIVLQKDDKEFPLLKTSLGIVEAKQFSLLMAHNRLQTICLEEPDRGMHPQMIERMKEVLHDESCKKTIIVVTHNPYLVDSTSLKNSFLFSRGENGSNVVNIYDELEKNELLKLLGTTEFKTLLFSSNVLFVEGPSDKLVLEAIFRNYGTSSKSFADSFPILRHGICSMGGKGKADKMKDFCKKLNIKFCIVVDRDVMMKDKESKIYYKSSFSSPFKEYDCSSSTSPEEQFQTFSNKLAENENLFIWKNGELEDFLLSENQFKICELLIPDDLSREDKYPFDATHSKYIQMKGKIKASLNDGISREQLDKLANYVINNQETKRLLNFLESINAVKYQ